MLWKKGLQVPRGERIPAAAPLLDGEFGEIQELASSDLRVRT